MAAFVQALMTELHLRADALDENFGPPQSSGGSTRSPLRSLYLGGGTPTLLPAESIERIVGIVRQRYGLANDAEVTIEANPGADERGDLRALREAGFNRLSIGAQSLDADEIRLLGRRHTPADVVATVLEARAAGIRSVSLDLLYDIPGASIATWRDTLQAAVALEPDHLSLYALTLDDPDAEGLTGRGGDHLPVTTGARRWRQRARPRQDEDRAAAMYELATERLAGAGYHSYEISNWARPGHASRHNLAYWQHLPYEAVGPGGHAFDGGTRRWTVARLDTYLAALAPSDGSPPRLPPGGTELVDGRMASAERTILALRLADGLAAAEGGREPLAGQLAWALEAGLLAQTPGERLVLTTRGRLLSNELFSRLV